MGVPGSNIGKAMLTVELLDKSPFKARPRQEFGFFLTPETLKTMESASGIYALPADFNGFRLKEDLYNYDNYLVDTKNVELGAAVLPDTGICNSDTASLVRSRTRSVSAEQKKFFTWQICNNLFVSGDQDTNNPSPTTFADASSKNDNTPKWAYNLKVKPDTASPNQNEFSNTSPLSPFMITTVANKTKPVHWGCQMVSSMPKNQPFSILFYHEGQIHSLAEETKSLTPRYQGLVNITATLDAADKAAAAAAAAEQNQEAPQQQPSQTVIGLDLTKRAYFAIETGQADPYHHLLFLFVQGISPQCYRIDGSKVLDAISEFSDFDGKKLFDPENSFFTVNFEQIATGLLITGNRFDGKYWAITAPAESPIFLGEGPLVIYSGNIQAGFLMRPIQYLPSGEFVTQAQEIRQDPNDDRVPTVTTALKGSGDITQQETNATTAELARAGITPHKPESHAVDAEVVNGNKITSFIESESGQQASSENEKISRVIALMIIPVDYSIIERGEDDPPEQSSSREYKIKVTLKASNVTTAAGFTIKNGRSPYIWQFRAELPLDVQGQDQTVTEDISCDVLGLELNWNATSIFELIQTGTLRVQNRPRVRDADYRDLTGRAIYLRISAWWEGGVGHDPGGVNRQIFEGLTVGSSVDTKAEQEVIVFKLEDYTNALEGSKFMNSPYYDGMKASKAVSDIVQQTGIPPSKILIGNIPITNETADDPNETGLPIGPNPLSQPMYKFEEGSSYKEAVVKIATWDGKVIYFDQFGNFHYDPIPGGISFDQDTTPVATFVTSPRSTTEGKLVVWNQSSFSRMINDVYNVLRVATVDKETGSEIHLQSIFEPGISDPNAEGYLGYAKRLDIFDPVLGGLPQAIKYFKTYRSRVFLPPLTTRFETFGYSGLKPLDVITLDGQKVRIVSISSRFDPKDNNYWMNVEGEWFFNNDKSENQHA